jgi:hypothetical protein
MGSPVHVHVTAYTLLLFQDSLRLILDHFLLDINLLLQECIQIQEQKQWSTLCIHLLPIDISLMLVLHPTTRFHPVMSMASQLTNYKQTINFNTYKQT